MHDTKKQRTEKSQKKTESSAAHERNSVVFWLKIKKQGKTVLIHHFTVDNCND